MPCRSAARRAHAAGARPTVVQEQALPYPWRAILGYPDVTSIIFVDSMRLALIGFGAISAYAGHLLLETGAVRSPGAVQATANGLGMTSLATASASAVLAVFLPAILA